MTRPAPRRLAARLAGALVTVLVTVPLAGLGAAATAAAPATTPLAVTIQSMTPSTVPSSGRVTVTGQITNRSRSTWTDLNVYLFTSATPMTTAQEVADASHTDPAAEVGSRITAPGTYVSVGDLAPGESEAYVLSVPRRDLGIPSTPGVYWVGVHVLGANEDGRDQVADGRARSFLPEMAPRGPSTRLSLVLPLEAPVARNGSGRLRGLRGWQRLLEPEGRLGRLLALAGTSDGTQATWVVDPAVLDAARSVAEDNPPTDIGPTPAPSAGPTPSPSPGALTGSPSPSPSDTASAPSDGSSPAPQPSPQAQVAADWLAQFAQEATRNPVLSLPYGDLDVASALRHGTLATYRRAQDLSVRTLRELGVFSTPAVAPDSGYLPGVALRKVERTTTVLLDDRAVPGATGPLLSWPDGPSVLLADSAAAEGGPAPNPPHDALALRQRILAEAAVHALSDQRDQPLIVTAPRSWDPGQDWRTADFFSGLAVPWLGSVDLPTLSTVAAAASSAAGPLPPVAYPARERRAELPRANLRAARQVTNVGRTLAGLLTRNATAGPELAKTGLLAASTTARTRPAAAVADAHATARAVRRMLSRVTIEGPSFVTMSSEQGTFQVTIINGLDQPVTVGITARTESGSGVDGHQLRVDPVDPVDLGPGQRASVRLHATSADIGVHSVSLMPTTADGRVLGNVTRVSVRSSQVGLVIWVIMGVGAAFLFVTAAIRVVRRVRARATTPGPLPKEEAR